MFLGIAYDVLMGRLLKDCLFVCVRIWLFIKNQSLVLWTLLGI